MADESADRLRRALDDARKPQPREPYPWIGRSDRQVTLNTRIADSLMAKLDWLVAQKGVAKREAVEQAIEVWVRAEMRRYGVKPDDT